MNILVMAGTKDAVNIIEMLFEMKKSHFDKNNMTKSNFHENNPFILATTTTDYGADLAKKAGADEVIPRGLSEVELVDLIQKEEVDVLIDATHPFASQATINAINSINKVKKINSEKRNSPAKYIRYERPSQDYSGVENIKEVISFKEAGKIASEIVETSENVLHLAGVSTIPAVLENVPLKQLIVRVLPNNISITQCSNLGIPGENIIAMQGVFSKEFNLSLMKEFHAGAIITKESGSVGGVPEKIEAALELGIDVILVKRPYIPELKNQKIVNNLETLENELESILY